MVHVSVLLGIGDFPHRSGQCPRCRKDHGVHVYFCFQFMRSESALDFYGGKDVAYFVHADDVLSGNMACRCSHCAGLSEEEKMD